MFISVHFLRVHGKYRENHGSETRRLLVKLSLHSGNREIEMLLIIFFFVFSLRVPAQRTVLPQSVSALLLKPFLKHSETCPDAVNGDRALRFLATKTQIITQKLY